MTGCVVVVRQCAKPLTSSYALARAFSWGKNDLLVVWIWSCEGKGTYSLLVFVLLGLFLAKPEVSWTVFKTALIFLQLQSQGIVLEAQKCLCTCLWWAKHPSVTQLSPFSSSKHTACSSKPTAALKGCLHVICSARCAFPSLSDTSHIASWYL